MWGEVRGGRGLRTPERPQPARVTDRAGELSCTQCNAARVRLAHPRTVLQPGAQVEEGDEELEGVLNELQ